MGPKNLKKLTKSISLFTAGSNELILHFFKFNRFCLSARDCKRLDIYFLIVYENSILTFARNLRTKLIKKNASLSEKKSRTPIQAKTSK